MTTRHAISGWQSLLALAALALLAAAALLTLSTAQAQQIRVAPATVTLGDPVGSTSLYSYFYIEARVQIGTNVECSGDAEEPGGFGICKAGREDEGVSTPIYADNATVTWQVAATGESGDVITCPVQPCIVEARGDFQTTRTDSNGRAWGVFRARSEGSVTITATAVAGARAPASDSIKVETGQTASSTPPDPGQIWLVAPLEQRRTASRFTAQAFVTDVNGAAVPDGTPVTWRAIGFEASGSKAASLETAVWRPGAYQRVTNTNNGVAESTWTRVSGNDNNNVLVIASAGDASGSVYMATEQAAATGEGAAVGLELERATGQERWRVLDPDDGSTLALNAKLTDAEGEPVPDGGLVYWDEGGIPATAGETVLSKLGDGTIPYSTTTTLGGGDPAGKAAYTFNVDAAGRGYVVARRGSAITTTRTTIVFGTPVEIPGPTIRTSHDHPIDVLWFNVGEYLAPPDGLAFSLRLAGDSDNVVTAGSTARIEGVLTYSGESGLDQILHVTGGTLRIAGSYDWEETRRNTFTSVPSSTARSRAALLLEHLLPLGKGFVGASASDWANGGECRGSSDGGAQWTCAIDLGKSEIVIPVGSQAGTFAVSGTLTVNGREFRSADPYVVQVAAAGEFDEVAKVEFDFPERAGGRPWPSSIAAGQSTRLRLQSLTENGGASPAGSLTTVFITTNVGSLSTSIGDGCRNGGGLTCEIPGSAINASNADKIDITLTHPGPGKSGTATVTATVVTPGEDFVPPSRSVIFLGETTAIAISEPSKSLLNQATSGDSRDVLTLTVSGADSAGNSAEVPYRNPRATLKGPDGKAVSRGISVVWTEDGDDADTTHDRFTRNSANAVQVTITATAASTAPLKTGDYTLELRTANHKAEQSFSVVGGVDSISIAAPEEAPEIGGQLVLKATVRDAAGMPAADGTSIDWSASNSGSATALVSLTQDSTTTGGEATGRFYVVGAGDSVVTATADGVRDVELVTVPGDESESGDGASAAPDLSGSFSTASMDSFTVWLGEETLVSAILAGRNGASSVRVWNNVRWLFYGVSPTGQLVPGSTDFQVPYGGVLWLSE